MLLECVEAHLRQIEGDQKREAKQHNRPVPAFYSSAGRKVENDTDVSFPASWSDEQAEEPRNIEFRLHSKAILQVDHKEIREIAGR